MILVETMIDNFDHEFGTNRIIRCPHCGIKLDKGQICWDVEKDSHRVTNNTNEKKSK